MKKFAQCASGGGAAGVYSSGSHTCIDAQQSLSRSTCADHSCCRIVPAGPRSAVGQSSGACQPYLPPEISTTEYEFTITLKEAAFSFVGREPRYAIAKYASGHLPKLDKLAAIQAKPAPAPANAANPPEDGSDLTIVDAHNVKNFDCVAPVDWIFNQDAMFQTDKKAKHAAATLRCTGTTDDVYAMRAEFFSDSTQQSSTAMATSSTSPLSVAAILKIKKDLSHSTVQEGKFDDLWVRVNLYEANPPKSLSEMKVDGKPIILCAPFFINLSDFVNRKKTLTTHTTPACANGTTLTFDLAYRTTRKLPVEHSSSTASECSGHQDATDIATHTSAFTTPKRFCSNCRLNVILSSPFNRDNLIGQNIRLKASPFLQIGSELQVCDANAADRFGVVTKCTERGTAGMTQLHVSVSPDVVWLPCCQKFVNHALEGPFITNVLHLFYLDSSGCCSLLDVETRLKMKHQEEKIQEAKVEAIARTNKLIQDARNFSSETFSLNSEEFCMLYLRRGFILSQPVISRIVKNIMLKLFPETVDETCIKFFGSKDGPWDIFSVFNSILNLQFHEKKFDNLVNACIPDDATPQHRDYARQRLIRVLDDIFHVRNMWAHVGASDADCKKALQAIIDFIVFTKGFLPDKEVGGNVEALVSIFKSMNAEYDNLSIDDIAYCFFLRSIRELSGFCAELCQKFPDLIISKELQAQIDEKNSSPAMRLRRQSKEIEIKEVALAVLNLPKHKIYGQSDLPQLSIDCQLIRTTRNALAHAISDSTKVILVLVALGAVARLVEFLNHSLRLQKASPIRDNITTKIHSAVMTIKLNQAVLMQLCRGKTGDAKEVHLFDLDVLLQFLAGSVEPDEATQILPNCPYFALVELGGMRATDFKKMQLILGRTIVGPTDFSDTMKAQQKALGFDKKVYPEKELPINPDEDADVSSDVLLCREGLSVEAVTNWHKALRIRGNADHHKSLQPYKEGLGNSKTPEDELKRCRTELKQIARVPASECGSVDAAVEWLLSSRDLRREKADIKRCIEEAGSILRRIMPRDEECSNWEIIMEALPIVFNSHALEDELKRCRTVLELVTRVPPAARDSVDDAVEWLLKRPLADSSTILQAHGLQLIKTCLDDALSARSTAFLTRLSESFLRQQDLFEKMKSARDDYEQECAISQRFFQAEQAFLSYLNSGSPDEMGQEKLRIKYFETIHCFPPAKPQTREHKFHERLKNFASRVCNAVKDYQEDTLKKDNFDSFFSPAQSDDLQFAKGDIKRYIEEAGSILRRIMPRDEECSNWEIIMETLPLVFNSRELTHFQTLSDPAEHFLFDSSVAPSRFCKPKSAAGFFKSCVKFMQPLLSRFGKPESAEETKEALGSEFFDALSHLAALSSIKLQPMIDIINRELRIPVSISKLNLGMNATNTTGGWEMIGRIRESKQFDLCIRPVFAKDSPPPMSQGSDDHCPIVLVHGMPGVGKSFFAGRELEKLQNEFDRSSQFTVYRQVIHGRGVRAVRDGLRSMGLALGIDSEPSEESLLSSLKRYLGCQRYVIMVDDIDPDGMRELFNRVPKSLQNCALILTTQWKYENVPDNEVNRILMDAQKTHSFSFGAMGAAFHSNIELGVFSEQESLSLVTSVCIGHEKLKNCLEARLVECLQNDLGHLPIAVHIFSNWLRQQFERAAAESEMVSVADDAAAASIMKSQADKIMQDWSQEAAKGESLLESTSLGFRGLRATVRLFLHPILSLSEDENFRGDAICFLKIMSLTDPNDVNIWSLFEPQMPFLYVDSKWASLVHFRKNFAATQDPLLKQLVDPKFSFFKFLDRIMEIAPLLTRRNPHGRPCIISMHQLIQHAISAELYSEIPKSDFILLKLLGSRITVGNSIYAGFNEYYVGMAHTAKLILHNLEEKYSGKKKMKSYHNCFAKNIDKERIQLRMGLATLFHRLGLDRESFALVSQILEHDNFPVVTLDTFIEVVDAQYNYSESIVECKHRWFFLLRKLQIECAYLLLQKSNVRIQTRYLLKDAPFSHDLGMEYFFNECSKVFSQVSDRFSKELTQSPELVMMARVNVPEFVTASARRGLQWHAEGKSGDGVNDQTLREASDIVKGSATEDKVRRMVTWFRKKRTDMDAPENKPSNADFPGAGAVAWAIWGGPTSGDTMQTAVWARCMVENMDVQKWISQKFVSGKILRYLLKQSKYHENEEMKTRAREFSRRIYDFSCVHKCFQDKRAFERNLDDSQNGKKLRQLKHLIQRQFFDLDKQAKVDFSPLNHSTDFLDYRRNYLLKSLAEMYLQHAYLLPLEERFCLLSSAIQAAYESERCSNATKSAGNINVAYRKQLLARCYGAYASKCDDAYSQFKKSLLYFSLALIGQRKFNDLHQSRESFKWLQDCQCQLSATLWQMQVVFKKPAVPEYLNWLKNGFHGLNSDCTQEEIEQLQALVPFDENHKQELQDGICQVCKRNFEYKMGPRKYQDDLKRKLIEHYEILTMLLQRKLQGGYFVRRQDLRDDTHFANAEIQKRRQIFDFVFTRDQMDSDPSIFVCAPSFKIFLWQMIMEDFIAPSKFWLKHSKQVEQLHDSELSKLKAQPSFSNFESLALFFEATLASDSDGIRKKFLNRVFVNKIQESELRMLQCATFDQRSKVIQEMEQNPKFQASDQMLKILFSATDVMDHQDRALRFVEKRRIQNLQVLAPLIRLSAERNRRDSLMKYWNTAIENQEAWRENGAELTNQLYARFHTLSNPNLAWHQLMRLIDPDAEQQWGSNPKADSQCAGGWAPKSASATFRCCLSSIPQNTTQADIAALFEIAGIQCTSIKIKTDKVPVAFSSQHDLDLALTMDKFVPYSGADPIAVRLHEESLPALQVKSAAASMCDIGVTLEAKDKEWVTPDNFRIKYSGVYIMAISPGKGAQAAKLPLYGRLVSVDGKAIKLDKKLADERLVGKKGTAVPVEVKR